MPIGGSMYLSGKLSGFKSFGYSSQMNRDIVENNYASLRSYGTSIFSTNAAASQELVTHSFQIAVNRIEAAVQERNNQLYAAADAINQFA